MSDTIFLAERLRAGDTILTGWSNLAAPVTAELMARGGYSAVTLDMQHGQHDIASVREGLALVALAGACGIVRIPVGEFASASRALDFGAEAVIAPMINSADDARAFVDAVKYPPEGKRSWGPHRAAMLKGIPVEDYLNRANLDTVAFAMIETPEAVAALDDILAVPGLDGVFVGPADMSLTVSRGACLEPESAEVAELASDIAQRTLAKGKVPGIFCTSVGMVKNMKTAGFRFLAYGVDMTFLMASASDAVAAVE